MMIRTKLSNKLSGLWLLSATEEKHVILFVCFALVFFFWGVGVQSLSMFFCVFRPHNLTTRHFLYSRWSIKML